MDTEKWDRRFLDLAQFISHWSKDPSTKVGAVLAHGKKILSVGYNGFPERVPDNPEWLEDRSTKYSLVTHAELNAYLNYNAILPSGTSLYIFPLPPCPDCTRFILASRLSRVVFRLGGSSSRFLDTLPNVQKLFQLAGVELVQYDE